MKNIIILILLIININSYCQINFNFDSKYREAELTFSDKHIEQGFIYGFIESKFFEFTRSLNPGLNTLETRLNLIDNNLISRKLSMEKLFDLP